MPSPFAQARHWPPPEWASKLAANIWRKVQTFLGGLTSPRVAAAQMNECFGAGAGAALTSGTSNTLVGFGTGGALTAGTNGVIVGAQAGATVTTASGVTYIG